MISMPELIGHVSVNVPRRTVEKHVEPPFGLEPATRAHWRVRSTWSKSFAPVGLTPNHCLFSGKSNLSGPTPGSSSPGGALEQ